MYQEMACGVELLLETKANGLLCYLDRIRVPNRDHLRIFLMNESHKTRYSIHPGADKMYLGLRQQYWWPGMKKDIALFVAKCLTCSKVKAEHQKPSGLLEQPEIPCGSGRTLLWTSSPNSHALPVGTIVSGLLSIDSQSLLISCLFMRTIELRNWLGSTLMRS
ncbi:hypothetical protein L1987_20782 [Smallanthus sonchifolius]|uniref:Uncharacterized protein n=1 Tax=Smallanthus sonchifolius TaxID=185202 RepID=A0ACB9IUG0_9ASTR|nr:hypothetical protein L1987_20782 [Smallanthus sonchifolius]